MQHKVIAYPLFFIILILWNPLASQENIRTGMIKGKLIDADTKTPLIGANVSVENTVLGAATDLQGDFVVKKIPVGSYTLKISYIGYEPFSKTDVIVKSKRITYINAELKMSPLEMNQVVVTGGFFSGADDQPTSMINFSNEEIRRAPGSGGDVSRIMMSLPGVAKVNDQSNSLIVRGGSPIENSFFIDNIEIPNINHFPDQASSGGPIGLINVDFIQDVNFHTGGFSAIYGDKLSSIMDITFREGNREEHDVQLDLNFAGFGGVAEGPLFNRRGSWMFSARRSYLDFVVDVFDVGSTVAPSYGDYQGKIVYDINQSHKLMLLGVFSDDHNAPDRETGEENQMLHYGNQDIYTGTVGMNWRAIWGKTGYSNTSLSYTSSKFNEDFYETNTGIHAIINRSHDRNFKFRNVNHLRFNRRHSIEFGMDAKRLMADFDNFYAGTTNALGDTVPALTLADNIGTDKLGVFLSYIVKPVNQLTFTLGARADYFSYNESTTISERFSFSYRMTPLTSFSGSVGLFHQNLPLLLLSQNEKNKSLSDPSAVHYVLGIQHLLTENTRLMLEIYQKDYDRFPIDPLQPALFLMDDVNFHFNNGQLTGNGKAYSRGIEVTLQKKLAADFYGLAGASYFRTRYEGGDGVWRNRAYDNQYIFSFEGGYKPNNKWEFSARWIYAGGVPFTPLDLEASETLHRDVLDDSRINDARYPDYHSLNIRFDRRFHFKRTNLIFYLSAWNVYNRKNIATYFWNEKEKKQDEIYQWLLLPIFGLEYEF